MKYVVAVSGGVDSVVLLDMLVKQGGHTLVVAHFDHGIRHDSADDARFVQALAARYELPFVMSREDLGLQAGEALARRRRYAFLRKVANQHHAVIATAHHHDDMIESIAINMIRGTGWRGLAVLNSADIWRPLLHITKAQIRDYANVNHLEWVEDSTNAETIYLRNRLRRQIYAHIAHSNKQLVAGLHSRQVVIKAQIDQIIAAHINKYGRYKRHFFIMVDQEVAIELLRSAIVTATGLSPTRPQTIRAIGAVKTARPGSIIQVGGGVALRFTTHSFIVSVA